MALNSKQQMFWTNEKRKLSDLKPWQRNPRQIKDKQAKLLAESFSDFGQVETIAISANGDIYNGHQRLSVLAGKYGMDYEVDVRVSSRDLTEKERERLTVYLHRGATGEWDFDELANWDMSDLLTWGFEESDFPFDVAPATNEGADAEPQTDKAEELRQKWGVQSGMMFGLGEHRIICGDCTDRAVVERVMGGEKAEMMFTDPPYNVDVAGGSHDPRDEKNYRSGNTVANDKLSTEDFYDFLQSSIDVSLGALNEGASIYMCFSDSEIKNFVNAFCRSGIYYSQMIVWAKQQMVFGRKDYHSKHEPILYGWKAGAGHYFADDRTQVSIWEIDRPMRSEKEHPTQKPLELYEKAFRNSSKVNSIIYEPFSGSGTCIIACENLSRKCRAVEISPAYVAVAIQRWVDVTGKEPILLDA